MELKKSRTNAAILNVIASIIGQSIGVVFTLIGRIIFLHVLNSEYLGLSGLFTNILTMLSFAELGIGPAISYSLYKPIRDNDTEKIRSLMYLYKKAYRVIGIIILLFGIIFLPLYKFFIKDIPNIDHLDLIFYLFVVNTGVSYFFSYKKSIFTCDQKRYVVVIFRYGFFGLLQILQGLGLLITGSYILYLVIQICLTLVENFSISHYANKKYPYLREKDVAKLSPGEIREIKKNVSAVLMHKIGGAIVNSTDNILLSKLFGLVVVGLYSNYYTIISALRTIIQQLFTSVVASIGNLHVDKSNEHEEVVFNRIFYANFWICSFSTICMLVLFKSFIMLWIGEEYILDDIVVYAISLSFYLENMRKTLISFKEATGAFYADRFRPIFESLINLCASIVLAKYLGISGIFWGTALASITTSWFETYIVYRDIFKKSMIRYYTRYLYYFLVTVAGYLICSAACSKIPYGFLGFVIKLFICVVLSNLIILVTTLRFDESKYYIFLVKKYTRKFRHK